MGFYPGSVAGKQSNQHLLFGAMFYQPLSSCTYAKTDKAPIYLLFFPFSASLQKRTPDRKHRGTDTGAKWNCCHFNDCIVNPSDGSLAGTTPYNYGQVAIDAFTAYHTFPKAYRYAAVTLTMNNNPYILQPYDYVGETPLTKGKYTYRIIYTNNQLGIILMKD